MRDRIAALAQGLPIIIDIDYCDVKMVTVADFPHPEGITATIFVNWVQLWDIAGRITKELLLKRDAKNKALLARELINWVLTLPTALQLPVGRHSVLDFNRDVYYLHLGYLTVVIVLHFSKGQGTIPRASMPAIAAASCIAAIFRAYLSRGSLQYLGCEAVWYCTVAILALLRARRIDGFTSDADADIATLRLALTDLSSWSQTGRMFNHGLERLFKEEPVTQFPSVYNSPTNHDIRDVSETPDQSATSDNTRWMDYFPNVTAQTSPLIAGLIVNDCLTMPFPQMEWPDDVNLQLQDLFRDVDDWNP